MAIFTGTNFNNSVNANGAPVLVGFTGGTIAQLTDLLGDRFLGLGGNDSIFAGRGNDTISGGDGNDVVSGGLGADSMDGGAGIDTLVHFPLNTNYSWDMQTGATNVPGETAKNFENARMGNGNDNVRGTSGANNILGGSGNDTLDGRAGNDSIFGGSGNDYVSGGAGVDFCDGGAGIDTYDMNNYVAIVLGTFNLNMVTGATNVAGEVARNFENVIGDGRENTIIGTAGANVISGNAGNDNIDGGAGADKLDGGSGFDTLEMASFSGSFIFNMATGVTNILGETAKNFEAVRTWDGNDRVDGTSGANRIALSGGNDIAKGLGGEDGMFGGAGNDSLDGGADRDLINGDGGNDTVIGGGGADILDGGTGVDTYDNSSYAGLYEFKMVTGATNLVGETAKSFEHFIGGSGSDRVTGTVAANKLIGNSGNDVLKGEAGNDSISGGDGADALRGGTGNDTLSGGLGIDAFAFDTVLNATTNVDTIADFNIMDIIWLDDAIFTSLSKGTLAASRFRIGTGAADFDDNIIYNNVTGDIFYDGNGVFLGGSVKFAHVNPGTVMTAADFVVI